VFKEVKDILGRNSKIAASFSRRLHELQAQRMTLRFPGLDETPLEWAIFEAGPA
jgi:hypothetical protein